jgi:hypothetical protein
MVPLLYRLKTRKSYCVFEELLDKIDQRNTYTGYDQVRDLNNLVNRFLINHFYVFHPTEPCDQDDSTLFNRYEFEPAERDMFGTETIQLKEPVPVRRENIRETFLIHDKTRMDAPHGYIRHYFHDYLGQYFDDAFLFGQSFSIHVRYGSTWDAIRMKKWGNGLTDETSSAS